MNQEFERLRDQVQQLSSRITRLETRQYIPPAMESYPANQRPAATSYPRGVAYWNETTNKPNWSDGAVWRDANGNEV